MRCLEIKKNGEQCKSQSVTDGIFCYFHDPDNKETLQKGRELAWSREYLDFDVLPREEIEDIVDKKNVNKASNADNRVVLKALTVLYRYLRDETEVGQWLWTKDWQDADISVNIGALHSAQMNVYTTESKRKCLSMGRRAGKTWLAARVSIRMAAMGHRVLYACPTSDQTDAYWEMVSMLCRDLPITKYESNRTINFGTGGKIKAKTAWDADSLRGDYADLLILDEYAYMDADAWEKVGQPMLLDNGGTAWFISTPKFRNHFFTLFSKAETSDRWASFHCTSHDNPHLDKDTLAEIEEDMTEDAYAQEILAQFLEGEGSVFKNIEACLHAPEDAHPDHHKGHRIVVGIDWGKHNDYTSFSIGCADCKKELVLYRSRNQSYKFQKARLAEFNKRWGFERGVGEANAMGEPILEEIEGFMPIEGFWTSNKSKKRIVEAMQLSLETQDWQFLPDKVGMFELMGFEAKLTRAGNVTFEGKPHDDTVIARCLMLEAANPVFVFV